MARASFCWDYEERALIKFGHHIQRGVPKCLQAAVIASQVESKIFIINQLQVFAFCMHQFPRLVHHICSFLILAR